jgi:hypothetical protein
VTDVTPAEADKAEPVTAADSAATAENAAVEAVENESAEKTADDSVQVC